MPPLPAGVRKTRRLTSSNSSAGKSKFPHP
jgi:hypothetical protein